MIPKTWGYFFCFFAGPKKQDMGNSLNQMRCWEMPIRNDSKNSNLYMTCYDPLNSYDHHSPHMMISIQQQQQQYHDHTTTTTTTYSHHSKTSTSHISITDNQASSSSASPLADINRVITSHCDTIITPPFIDFLGVGAT